MYRNHLNIIQTGCGTLQHVDDRVVVKAILAGSRGHSPHLQRKTPNEKEECPHHVAATYQYSAAAAAKPIKKSYHE